MATQSFKIGDVVQLKSGGPKMTVQALNVGLMGTGEDLSCVWFVGTKQESGHFHPDTVELARKA